ncbi:MAG: hypothetical protein JST92_25955, partial [Deltaproteobacteria bacterium]|nr:hypothetical protein [Deltaproteobacteria bacterium]
YAAASGALVGGVAGAAAGKGAETVYVALDGSKGGVATASEAQQARAASVYMSIVAAIPPAPPPLETMGSGTEARARHHGHGHKGHGHAHEESEGGASASKIEGSVDAVAQRILHRIRARLMFDRERFNG